MKRDTSVGRDLKHGDPFHIIALAEYEGQVAIIPSTTISSTLNEESIENDANVKVWYKLDLSNRIDAVHVLINLKLLKAEEKGFASVQDLLNPQPYDVVDFINDRNLKSIAVGHDEPVPTKRKSPDEPVKTITVIDEYHITAPDSTVTGVGLTQFEAIIDFLQKSISEQATT